MHIIDETIKSEESEERPPKTKRRLGAGGNAPEKLSDVLRPFPIKLPKRIFEELNGHSQFHPYVRNPPSHIDEALDMERMCKYFDSLPIGRQQELRREMMMSGKLVPAYFVNRMPEEPLEEIGPSTSGRMIKENWEDQNLNYCSSNLPNKQSRVKPILTSRNIYTRNMHGFINQNENHSIQPQLYRPKFNRVSNGSPKDPFIFAFTTYDRVLEDNEVIDVEMVEATCLQERDCNLNRCF